MQAGIVRIFCGLSGYGRAGLCLWFAPHMHAELLIGKLEVRHVTCLHRLHDLPHSLEPPSCRRFCQRVDSLFYAWNRCSTSAVLCPPNPKEFESAVSMCAGRATFGT